MQINKIQDIQALLPNPFITREIDVSLVKSLHEKEVTVLYGPRQVGKSSEIMRLIKSLLLGSQQKDIFYFNLDSIPSDFRSPDTFLNSITAQKKYPKAPTYIFLDEAQRLEDIGLFVKYLYDKNLSIKFVLTGSASLDIKEKIKEPLTGRKQEFYLGPLNLGEILKYRNVNISHITGTFSIPEEILENYLLYGGYPAVVIAPTDEKKKQKLEEIAESYIMRDIADLFDIHNTEHLRLISSFAAENIGSLFSKENLSQMVAVSKYEIEKILTALEKTFILFFLYPLAKDKTRELMHRPKIYFHDCGIRNAVLGKLSNSMIVADKGELFENAIAIQFHSLYGRNVKFWRTYNQTEIDFIVEKTPGRYNVWEAKYSNLSSRIPKNITSFTLLYQHMIESTQVVSRENYWNIFRKNIS